jgi:TIR domain/Pentapeptide repeats (8 copies)
MADEEHVKRLKQGIAEWNAWRQDTPTICPDLSETNLSEANLIGANLGRANLSSANLSRVDLRDANLIDANLNIATLASSDLRGAKLEGASLRYGASLIDASLGQANLIDADLRGANLSRADLSGADLSRTSLRAVILNSTILDGTILTAAYLRATVFADVDLTSVVGLATCDHGGPSKIDYRTLQRSGSLPIQFLRGVGLPDNLIEYLPSLFNQAIQHYSCFISYSTKDQEFADRLYADLQNKGVRCWFASHDLRIGDKILDAIDAAIRVRERVVLILSEHSIKSDWVEDEVTAGFEEERKREQIVLFPIRLDDAVMNANEAWAAKLRARNIGDFRKWKDHGAYKQGLERVLRDLVVSPAK